LIQVTLRIKAELSGQHEIGPCSLKAVGSLAPGLQPPTKGTITKDTIKLYFNDASTAVSWGNSNIRPTLKAISYGQANRSVLVELEHNPVGKVSEWNENHTRNQLEELAELRAYQLDSATEHCK